MSPSVHGDVVGHLRAVHATYGCYELVRHRADGRQIVFHGEIDVARPHESALPVACLLAVFHRSDHRVLSLERRTPARTEVRVGTSGFEQPLCLMVSFMVIGVIVKLVFFVAHDVVQF